jgi:hypothetical protein
LARKRLDRDTFDLVEVGLMIEHLMEIWLEGLSLTERKHDIKIELTETGFL